ncbi:Deoxyguanosinetriphosphate triphosphohydrolase [Planctomycetes bacterium Pan216]|uniref:Deoxyguanosinetriphosphate triphosphohydrolase n=1 Tax=Kolteria novifilia TaxID=2527975 RepID=A0A518B4G1_9BACT|nr:Deoxyguanosinetriphosphate triphosphohydrolase [Planctomycetes bacterium Pan216]
MSHRLTWKRLLCSERVPRPATTSSGTAKVRTLQEDRSPFEQDYDRIVFSPPFRKLARKTQVHPMASNDRIHNRLTHSIEVASVGRSFATLLAKFAVERSDLDEQGVRDLPWILQSACLMHDLGNPPFGHAGEKIIRQWAREHVEELLPKELVPDEQTWATLKADWLNFEGNAQGFRLAARADNPLPGYLRLTYATLGAAVKYPWSSADPRTTTKQKHNIYSTEVELFTAMADRLGLANSRGDHCRHPLSFLMEAADDICYRIIDLEDAVEMGICDAARVHNLLARIAVLDSPAGMPLSRLRGQAIASLMGQCWEVFRGDFGAIMNGDRLDSLRSSLGPACHDQLKEVDHLYDSIFGQRKKVATELGAYHVLGRILKAFVKSVRSIAAAKRYAEIHFLSQRTIELTWGQRHVEKHLGQPYGWWLSQVMDYVSGMTDDHATRLSQVIAGVSFDLE